AFRVPPRGSLVSPFDTCTRLPCVCHTLSVASLQPYKQTEFELAQATKSIMTDTREGAKGLNILCIGKASVFSLLLGIYPYSHWYLEDGGGARGLSSLVILREFMHRINSESELQNKSASLKPCDLFDIIAGTGTGGISACMLGRLRMPIDKSIEEYSKLMKKMFSEKKMTGPTLYKGKKLQKALKTMIQDTTGSSEEPMIDSRDQDVCRTVVFAMASHNLGASIPVLFRSYHTTSNPSPECAMWQALYATMAHPDLFKGIEIVDCSVPQSFVGGELGCSNPLGHVLTEIKQVFSDRQVACIISIGAGHVRTIQVPRLSSCGPFFRVQDARFIEVVKAIATDSERAAEDMAGRFRDTSGVYFRFNVDQGMQDMKHGGWERLNEVMEHTKLYLRKNEINQRLNYAILASKERQCTLPTTCIGGQILTSDITGPVEQPGSRGVDGIEMDHRLDRLSPSLSARYNSAQAAGLQRGPCTNGTRVDLIAHVLGWLASSTLGSMYWVSGMAGTGKTTIAYSLCAELDINRQLGASFFCSRLLPECRDVNLIIPSIAYQLARFSPPFRSKLVSALEKDPDMHTLLPHLQFDALIVEPLQAVKETLSDSLVVVIDALDECDDTRATSQIIDILLTKTSNLPLRFIVSSRPEPEIREEMRKQGDQANSRVVLHELDRCTVQADIEMYLRATLAPMGPTEEQISILVDHAGVLFIYAATVVRYISHNRFRQNHRARLADVLDSSSRSKNQHKEIDGLYTTILRAAFDDPNLEEGERKDMQQVLHTVICAQEPLTVNAICGLLRMDTEQVRAALLPLWSVLHIAGESELVTTLHASFPDYMLDSSRSERYHCDQITQNQLIAGLCFDCLERVRPQFNICGLDSSYVRDDEVDGIEERIQSAISTELFYASRYWAVHLKNTPGSSALMQQLEEFLSTRLLLWMEVMNLKKRADDMRQILQLAEKWDVVSCANLSEVSADKSSKKRSTELDALIHDSWRFASTFALGAAVESTPHIYTSILPFWPENSPLYKCYREHIKGLIRTEGTAISRQDRALIATWSFEDYIKSPMFSPDGTQIAAHWCQKVYLLSSLTGRMILSPFEAHQNLISWIGFSPDGSRIAASDGETVYVWSTRSGKVILGPLEGIAGSTITQFVFSPDGGRVLLLHELLESGTSSSETVELYGTNQYVIRIWDASGGIQATYRPILEGIDITAASLGCSSGKQHVIFAHKAGISICNLEGVCTREIPIPNNTPVSSGSTHSDQVVMSPHGTHIAALLSRSIFIWDLVTGDMVFRQPEIISLNWIDHISFSPSGFYLATHSDEGIYIWDVRDGNSVFGPLERTESLKSPRFSPDDTSIICSSYNKTLSLWDVRSPCILQDPLQGHTGLITSVGFHPDGTRLVSGSSDGTARVWDIVSGEEVLRPLQRDPGRLTLAAFSPDGNYIAIEHGGDFALLDARTGNQTVEPLKLRASNAVFSPDGTFIAITVNNICSGSDCSFEGNTGIIAASTGKTLWSTYIDDEEFTLSPTFSPDGVRLIVRSCFYHSPELDREPDLDDDQLYVYDAKSGELLDDGVYGNFYYSEVMQNGAGIISYFQSQLIVQDIETGIKKFRPLELGTDEVTLAKFSPDCARVAIAMHRHKLYIYDTHTCQRILHLVNWHTSSVNSMEFSPDGTQLASGSNDQAIRITDIQAIPSPPLCSSPEGLGEWSLRDDGWVVDESGKLLAWIPPNLRASLMHPRTKLLISVRGFLRLNFEGAHIGKSWFALGSQATPYTRFNHSCRSLTHRHSFKMRSYLLTTLSLPLFVSCSLLSPILSGPYASPPRSFERQQEITGSGFYDAFNFETFNDPTHGRVNYVDQNYSQEKNLTFASDSKFVMRADSLNVVKPGSRGRDSIRISSKQLYEDSVVVLDLTHMPTGCGTWPAFWTVTANGRWPQGGEIDIIEGINNRTSNLASLHTTPECNMTVTPRPMTGVAESNECDVRKSNNQGCGVRFDEGSYGPGFNAREGGWYAMRRTVDGISVWFWGRDDFAVPLDVKYGSKKVEPEYWGLPVADFPSNNCDMRSHFGKHTIVFDLTFCGDWAGNEYPRSGCPGTCVDFVDNNPKAFVEAYWEINSLRTYV
ncbi:unnamed protein product, partial [Rhizoctonia solani]